MVINSYFIIKSNELFFLYYCSVGLHQFVCTVHRNQCCSPNKAYISSKFSNVFNFFRSIEPQHCLFVRFRKDDHLNGEATLINYFTNTILTSPILSFFLWFWFYSSLM